MLTCSPVRATRRIDEVVQRHAESVYRVASRLVETPAHAEALTAQALRKLTSGCPFAARSSAHALRVTIDAARDGATSAEARDASVPSLMAALAFEDRAALVLHDVEGLPYRKAARAMRTSTGRFKRRLNAARRELAARLVRSRRTPA